MTAHPIPTGREQLRQELDEIRREIMDLLVRVDALIDRPAGADT